MASLHSLPRMPPRLDCHAEAVSALVVPFHSDHPIVCLSFLQRIHLMEDRLRVPAAARFPSYQKLMWCAAQEPRPRNPHAPRR